MPSIQTSTGLITGLDIVGTVDKLMAIAARPQRLLKSRGETMQSELVAVTSLTALLVSTRFMTDNLGKESIYQSREVSSSDPLSLTASMTADKPAIGRYSFTPLRTASNQQWLSSGVLSNTAPLPAGTFSFRHGSTVQRDVRVELLSNDQGLEFARGKIRITDRSGASAEIDLSSALTIDDVLKAINDNSTINVEAAVRNGRLTLTDNTGLQLANLRVQEVGGGRTAASLGLAGIDVSSSSAEGGLIWRLRGSMSLDELNDGRGVRVSTVLPDIAFQLRDGTSGEIDLSPLLPNSATVDRDVTLDDVINRINEAAPGKLLAEIAPDGERLIVSDLTAGGGEFALTALNGSAALADLGLSRQAENGQITGNRILGGLKTVLLSSLDGGRGLGPLGRLRLVDRSGGEAIADLSAAETLEDVVQAINSLGLKINAGVNSSGNGVELTDRSGAASSNLIVADADGGSTAQRLGLAVDAPVTRVNSGDLKLQVVSENTLLSSLNGGAGAAKGTIVIQDTQGLRYTVNLRDPQIKTVGEVIRAINHQAGNVRAEINERGDGIRLVDSQGGAGQLSVSEGDATTARDLGLLRPATDRQVDGAPAKVIDGSMTAVIALTGSESLNDLVERINGLNAGVSATVVYDGSSRPYRIALTSQRSGRAGNLVFDSSIEGLSFSQTVAGDDALLLFGPGNLLVSSSTNKFENVVKGMELEVKQGSGKPVAVTVSAGTANMVASAKTFVDNYNKFRDKLKELTKFDSATGKGSILSGDPTAVRLDSELSRLLSGRIDGAGRLRTLGDVGITINDQGQLEFDESKLRSAFAADPEAVQQFFTTAEKGFSARFKRVVDQLAGDDSSMLSRRIDALNRKIALNQERIDFMQKRLDSQRERLLLQFYNMELAIGKIKNNLTAIDSIQPITIQRAASR